MESETQSSYSDIDKDDFAAVNQYKGASCNLLPDFASPHQTVQHTIAPHFLYPQS